MNAIEAAIFDAGGVLRKKVGKGLHDLARKKLRIPDMEEYQKVYKKLYPLVTTGKLSEEEFWRQVHERTAAKGKVPKESLFLTYHKRQYQPNDEVLATIELLLQEGIAVALCSNSVPSRAQYDTEQGLYNSFLPSHRILSHEVGYRKPQPEIYQRTLAVLGSSPQKTFFIDDHSENTAAAETLGMRGIIFQNPQQLNRILFM